MRWARAGWLLLFLPLAAPAGDAQAEQGALLEILDGERDVAVRPYTASEGVPTPAQEDNQAVDILALRLVEESVDLLRFELELRGGAGATAGESRRVAVYFNITGRSYALRTMLETRSPTASVHSCESRSAHDHCEGRSYSGNAQAAIDPTTGKLYLEVRKGTLARLQIGEERQTPAAASPALPAGTPIEDVRASVERYQGSFMTVSDRAPDRGKPAVDYTLRLGGSDRVLSLATPNERRELRTHPVNALSTTGIPLLITNAGTTKRLVNVTAQPLDEVARNWKIQVPATLVLPANRTQTMEVRVQADGGTLGAARVLIVARSLGHADEIASETLHLIAFTPLTPSSPKLFFHAQHLASGAYGIPAFCEPVASYCYQRKEVWLSGAEVDAAGTADAAGIPGDSMAWGLGQLVSPNSPVLSIQASTRTTQPHDVYLDISKPIALKAKFRTEMEFAARVSVALSANGTRVAQTETQTTLTPATGLVEFSLPVPSRFARLEAEQTFLVVTVAVYRTDDLYTPMHDLVFVPKDSLIELPIVPPPQRAAESQKRLAGLFASSDLQEFVNPGEARLLRANLTNEVSTNETLRLLARADPPSWPVQVLPGSRVKLQAGETVGVAVLARPAPGAKEGEKATIFLRAESENDVNAFHEIAFTLIATSHDVPDDAGTFKLSEEDRGKVLPEPGAGSPLPGWVVVAAFAVCALAGAPRRKR